jgi:UDP-N-acetylmuramoyl-L-alanyl-D-glutamate--2,6-diaminopimelate ligase
MTIHKLHEGNGQIITVVGCGGDRDRGKRPKMAKVACDYSDQIILTSDNPRSEDPDVIIEEMEVGIPPYNIRNVLSITNRKQAIKTACTIAKSGDIILIAGKGHEKYQEIKGERKHFDDKEELRDGLGLTVHGSR